SGVGRRGYESVSQVAKQDVHANAPCSKWLSLQRVRPVRTLAEGRAVSLARASGSDWCCMPARRASRGSGNAISIPTVNDHPTRVEDQISDPKCGAAGGWIAIVELLLRCVWMQQDACSCTWLQGDAEQ